MEGPGSHSGSRAVLAWGRSWARQGGVLAEWEDRDLRPQLGRDVQCHSRASRREGKA